MKALLLILTVLFVPFLHAAKQGDTSIWRSFELIATKGNVNSGSVKINLPSAQDGSLADVLNKNSALFIKYYSPGSLATTSMRGMGAQHTAILWNGINLQSCMNSILDLNLLPMFFLDKASIETGANAASCGNGAIAGAIILNNEIKENSISYGELAIGSFGQLNMGFGASVKLKKLLLNTRILKRKAQNDFEYFNFFKVNKPKESMQNNQFNQIGFMQEASFTFKNKHTLYFNYWYMETKRQLPSALGVSLLAKENQDDYNTLFLIKHEYKLSSKTNLINKLAYTSENINYFNLFYPDAYNAAKSVITESEFKTQLNRSFELLTSINNTYQKAWTDGYRLGIDRNLSSIFAKLTWSIKSPKLKISFADRQLVYDSKFAPVTPDLGIEFQASKSIKLKSNAAYSYRLPSFNDLYWQGGGNVNLLPEKGKKIEASLEYKLKSLKAGLTGFFHHVDNWILWIPSGGASSWKASNAKEIQSKGLEFAMEYKYLINTNSFFKFYGRYQFVESVNTDVYGADKSLIGKQLFYTPKQTGIANIQYLFGKNRISLSTTFTGSRYATADNHADGLLSAYSLFNFSLARDFYYKSLKSAVEFTVSNLLNTNYYVFENRPMPLRNYQITFKFNINHEH
jgi:iron complex outermembrane receptor protein